MDDVLDWDPSLNTRMERPEILSVDFLPQMLSHLLISTTNSFFYSGLVINLKMIAAIVQKNDCSISSSAIDFSELLNILKGLKGA